MFPKIISAIGIRLKKKAYDFRNGYVTQWLDHAFWKIAGARLLAGLMPHTVASTYTINIQICITIKAACNDSQENIAISQSTTLFENSILEWSYGRYLLEYWQHDKAWWRRSSLSSEGAAKGIFFMGTAQRCRTLLTLDSNNSNSAQLNANPSLLTQIVSIDVQAWVYIN